MKRRISAFILVTLLLLLAKEAAVAQIIDDSTRLLYSPKTTLELYERNVLEGDYTELPIDTSLNNMQNERYWFNDTTFYQHLGNVGTAATPMLFQMPDKIGVRLGKNIFDRYAYDPQRINYYNTRSPYTHLYYVQGGRGEQTFEALHTRNINPRWNFGLAYQILSADQQIGPASQDRRNKGFLDNQAVKLFTHYRSENEKYDLFFNYTFMKVEQIETGGIRPGEDDRVQADIAGYQQENVNLTQAANEESRNNLHLTHIYRVAKENLKAYHTLDYYRQRNEYTDNDIPSYLLDGKSYLYPNFYYSKERTEDATAYKELENTVGMTGNNRLSSYKAYMRVRNSSILYSVLDSIEGLPDTVRAKGNYFQTLTSESSYNQVFLGGSIRLFYKELAELTGNAEYQLAGDYKIKGMARLGGAYGSLERVLYTPSLVQRYMLSNHFKWDDDRSNMVIDRIEAGINQRIGKRQYFKFNANYTNIKRWVFFNERAQPERAGENQRFWGGRLSHNINFGPVHFENFVSYTNTDEADKVIIPEWLWDSKVYIEGPLFKGALYTQLGLHGTINSDYYAYGYMPVTQQFFVQNDFQVQAYPVIDVFVNADIKTINVFLKMSHINYGLTEPVNFITPYYPGMRRSFVFGVQWRFFD